MSQTEEHKCLPKICYLQVVASEDRIPWNTETKSQVNPGTMEKVQNPEGERNQIHPGIMYHKETTRKVLARTINDVAGFQLQSQMIPPIWL